MFDLAGGLLIQKRRAEKALEESSMSYCIVRPGGMERPGELLHGCLAFALHIKLAWSNQHDKAQQTLHRDGQHELLHRAPWRHGAPW